MILCAGNTSLFTRPCRLFFESAGVTSLKVKDGVEKIHVHGKSLWGEANKVAMMRAALTLEGLTPEDMLWGFSRELDDMVKFISRANAS